AAFCKTLETYAGKPVEAPEALLHTVIRNELLTRLRPQVMKLVQLDEDYVGLMAARKGAAIEDPNADGPERVLVWSSEDKDNSATRRTPRQPNVPRTPEQEAEHLENMIIETIDVTDLVRTILRQLDERYRHIVVLLLVEWTPAELRAKLGRNGYRMRVW